MLINLHVKNLAIIDEVEVDFTQKFNVMTGETGAGKSIIIGSINTALGGKVSKDMIRKDKEFALIELLFSVETEEKKKLEDIGISFDDDTILISRKITQTRTVNRINGESVTVAVIKKVAEYLIDIHGQNEQQSLLKKNRHLEILDSYAKKDFKGIDRELEETYKVYKDTLNELQTNEIPEKERNREISFMEYELEEIENAKLIPGEEEELEAEYKKLSNATDIAKGLAFVYQNTDADNASVSERLSESIRELSSLSQYDEKINEFCEQLSEIDGLITDFNREISGYMDEFEVGEEDFAKVEKRLDLIRSIKAKYGRTTLDVMDYADKLREKLEFYSDYEKRREHLREILDKNEKKLKQLSNKMTEIRKKSAKVLEKNIKETLLELNFLQVEFNINISKKEDYTPKGMDDVEFMISTNPGMELRPLANAASGGELSRIMLAIKAVFVEHDEIETMIFDEIDVGISGRTAQLVAEKMAMIGRKHQVICISHLAQIAAMGDSHFLIEKKNIENTTKTTIEPLDNEESIKEIARILGGAKITESVIASAREMKELADKKKLKM